MKILNSVLREIVNGMNMVPIQTIDKKPIDDKLTYAVVKFGKLNIKALDALNSEMEDIEIDNAYTDENGVLQYEGAGGRKPFKYTKEGMKAMKAALRVLEKKEVEITPYLCKDLTRVDALPKWVRETLNGYLFTLPKESGE